LPFEADQWSDRLSAQRHELVVMALALADIEEDIARTFTVIAATSPHRAERLLGQAHLARMTARKQRALARRYDAPVPPRLPIDPH
jgi:hypothetical protein